ncbi:MAG: hypothetical protein MI785_14995 [Kiloniellales bacterium]|nr:hypothetical protein [Kiloniellales bacterium]
MAKASLPRAAPRLVIDNGSRRIVDRVVRKERLKLFKGRGRELPAFADAPKELPVIDDNGPKSRFGYSALGAVPLSVPQKLFSKGHGTRSMLSTDQIGGNTPHLSRGYAQHARSRGMRDTSVMDQNTKAALIHRIEQRLKELDVTANAASEAAGMERGYIKDLKRSKTKSPTWDALLGLAKALQCDVCWLATGRADSSSDPVILEAINLLSDLGDTRRQLALVLLRDLIVAEERGLEKELERAEA